jgi:hypothetical protein
MGFAKINGPLTSRIGCTVRFSAPKDVEAKGGSAGYGVIVDEMWADLDINSSPPREAKHNGDWGDYSFCAQLIKWDGEDYTIRLAYYRRRTGEDFWEFASQMTVNSDWYTVKTLLEKTLSKTEWFRDDPEYPGKPK